MSDEITILYFARLREAVGTPEERMTLPEAGMTAGSLLQHLAANDDTKRHAFDGIDVKIAVNQQQADAATPVNPGDEVAFFPPVTGG